MSSILEIRGATVYRQLNRVFHGLDLVIGAGCHTAILGPNGAGKSTLLKLLTRELYPVHDPDTVLRLFGKVRWNVWELRQRLGIVSHDLQTRHLGNPIGRHVILSGYHSSIGIASHHEYAREQLTHADELMERLGVAHLHDRQFASMSTGEQRRFLLGRALVHDPEVLVLDEPTSGLDLRAMFQYLQLVRDLIAAGKTIILVTHHIHEIPPEIERIVLIKGGEVVADGEKSEILTKKRLAGLFETDLEIAQVNGYYQAMPAEKKPN
ncbi:MAG: iron complex transport system ATP-binding protein [Verrucomicrobiales bacterium]